MLKLLQVAIGGARSFRKDEDNSARSWRLPRAVNFAPMNQSARPWLSW